MSAEKKLSALILLLLITVAGATSEFSVKARYSPSILDGHPCSFWVSQVDPSAGLSEDYRDAATDMRRLSEEEVLHAIRCLLTLEGNRSPARFSGATNSSISQVFDEHATVEVAALFYISFLFYGEWDHADAVALEDGDGRINSPEAISEAYKKYRDWFHQVESVGLDRARKSKLDPLRGSSIRWY